MLGKDANHWDVSQSCIHFFNIYFYLCVCVYTCVRAHSEYISALLLRLEEGDHNPLQLKFQIVVTTQYGYWELNSGPLQKDTLNLWTTSPTSPAATLYSFLTYLRYWHSYHRSIIADNAKEKSATWQWWLNIENWFCLLHFCPEDSWGTVPGWLHLSVPLCVFITESVFYNCINLAPHLYLSLKTKLSEFLYVAVDYCSGSLGDSESSICQLESN